MTDSLHGPGGIRADLHEAAGGVADMVDTITDFAAPGLGKWDLMGLSGHFIRAGRTPTRYLAEPEPEGTPLRGAASYIAAYLERRDRDISAMESSVAERGFVELTNEDRHPAELIREAAVALDDALAINPEHRLVPTPFGSLRLDEYLRTRTLEVTVHGLDIARAIGAVWTPPPPLLIDAISLLGEVALLRGSAVDLICVLTGRTPPEPRDVLPILQ
jgi:hypothetical protein